MRVDFEFPSEGEGAALHVVYYASFVPPVGSYVRDHDGASYLVTRVEFALDGERVDVKLVPVPES